MNKKQQKSQYEIFRKTRGSWGDISPVTRIIPNKKRNPKDKYKKQNLMKEADC